jgi:uncharacterized membrane-anchored protein
MGTVLKIIATIIITLVAGLVVLLAIAVAGSSHNIAAESRKESMTWGIAALVAGPVFIVMLWLPWRRILNR